MRNSLTEAATNDRRLDPVPAHLQPERASVRSYVDVKQTATRWGVSERFVRRAVYEGKIPYYKFGKLVRFDVNDVEAFAAAGRIEATDRP